MKTSPSSPTSSTSSKSLISKTETHSPAKQLMKHQKQLYRLELYKQMKQKNFHKKKILVLDLDETLVHASATFPYYKSGKPVVNTYQLDLYVENNPCTFYISERPFVHLFMAKVCEWYQVIIFTASVKAYADPVIDRLDRNHLIKERLFRESCATQDGVYIKDLSIITDDLSKCVIIDNSPLSYAWQPENAIPIESWLATRESDEELLHLLPFLDALRYVQDCRNVLSLRLQQSNLIM